MTPAPCVQVRRSPGGLSVLVRGHDLDRGPPPDATDPLLAAAAVCAVLYAEQFCAERNIAPSRLEVDCGEPDARGEHPLTVRLAGVPRELAQEMEEVIRHRMVHHFVRRPGSPRLRVAVACS